MNADLEPQIARGFAALKSLIETRFDNNFSKVAKALDLTPQAVSEVMRKGNRCPVAWCPKIETITDGEITCHQLRPDLYLSAGVN